MRWSNMGGKIGMVGYAYEGDRLSVAKYGGGIFQLYWLNLEFFNHIG